MELNGTLVECRRAGEANPVLRFLILDAPSPSSLPMYVKLLQKNKVKHLVRACGPTYNSEVVEQSGIEVHGWTFDDGAPPTPQVIDNWLDLLERLVTEAASRGAEEPPTVAVHCVAGLGRAPILVAIALVEYGNMPPLDAVGYVRERRKGAINQVQLNWLMKYKPRLQQTGDRSLTCANCVVM